MSWFRFNDARAFAADGNTQAARMSNAFGELLLEQDLEAELARMDQHTLDTNQLLDAIAQVKGEIIIFQSDRTRT